MRINFFLLAAGLFFSQLSFGQTLEEEKAAIRTVCNYYLDGGTNGDSVMFSKAFFPGGQMQYMRRDTVIVVSLKDFMARMPNTGKKTDRTTKIESVEVYGNAAVAKLTIEYPTFFFHDIMSLLKTKEGWKIVGKIFYRQDKPKTSQ
ncbi:MAG: nuclear transport factor 2 family protein [Chitinophagaceae bacterium]|nr:nuclear transport factor 2 family protein [Chitinophagaceae bacterium]